MTGRSLVGRPLKTIQIAWTGSVDITQMQPVVDHPLMQRLRRRKQLGEGQVVYPDALHSRLSHSLGVYALASHRLDFYHQKGWVTKQDVINGKTHAVVHDVAHGPLSHLTDPLVSMGHDERADALLVEMAAVIASVGADVERIRRMMRREDPLSCIVMDNPLGCDKLDYLSRDAYQTGLGGAPDVGPMLDFVYYLDGQLVADPKIREDIQQLQAHYRRMYARVYFRTAILMSERYIQQMISQMLVSGELTEVELVAMTDDMLRARLATAQTPMVRDNYTLFLDRQQPKPAVVYQVAPYHQDNWEGRHKVAHLDAPEGLLADARLRNPGVLSRIEFALSQEMGFPILAVPPPAARRFHPSPITFLTNSGYRTLQQMDPDQWEALMSDAKRYMRLYLGTYDVYNERLSNVETARRLIPIIEDVLQD